MATSKKHVHDGTNESDIPAKISTKSTGDELLANFLKWSKDENFCVSEKVSVSKAGSCAQYGMMAVEDIEKGVCLFQIPRPLLLTPETCAISELLQEESADLQSSSGWVPILVALMYEYNNPSSKWRPYMDLVPDFKELDLPMFWSKLEREKLLLGSGIQEAVDRDLASIEKDFTILVLPFVQKHKDIFSSVCQDIEFYKKMVAFVMAYSFTEPIKEENDIDDESEGVASPPMMVPMADILNHVAKNNANLTFEKDALKMVSTKPIKKGEEIFNTYGQVANWHLLHMYGFAEPYPGNHYDTVDIPINLVLDASKKLPFNTDELVLQKWEFLQAMDLASDDVFIVGVDGILTEDEFYNTLKVLAMSATEFAEHKEKDGWSEDDDDDSDDESLSFEKMRNLTPDMKTILISCAKACQKKYATSLDQDEDSLTAINSLPSRNKFAFLTYYGQKKLLQKILDCCS